MPGCLLAPSETTEKWGSRRMLYENTVFGLKPLL